MNLKKILVGAVLAVSALSLLAEAGARPMGGGRSIGRQSQSVSRMPPSPPAQQSPRPAAAPAPMPGAPAMPPPRPAIPWKGIVGGALLGLGMGALMSHFGMGGALGSIFGTLIMLALLGGAVFLVLRLLRGNRAPAQFGGNGGNGNGQQGANSNSNFNAGNGYPAQGGNAAPGWQPAQQIQPAQPAQPAGAPAPHQPWGVPADFDTAAFLRVAKGNFIRLQAAWDKGDVGDIREFTTPEVFAEMKLQITERGAQADFTDVVSIDAELLGIETGASDYLASVKFTGRIKPARDALAEPFNEVWNLSKPLSGNGGWLLAGIQQIA